MRKQTSIEQSIHVAPNPAKVAFIVDEYGWEAATERWNWVDKRTLGDVLMRHRRGMKPRSHQRGRKRPQQN
jgi:hypothetical protein